MANQEPVAIIGLGCRMAGGVDTPGRLWDLLLAGEETAGPLPAGRWDGYARNATDQAVLRRTTSRGSFLPDIAGFDSTFFGIAPREARVMDPQQRIALEVAWEALEHAGIPVTTLAASRAGVFTGVGSADYGRRLLDDLPGIDAWTGIGGAYCGVANRISHTFDLRGPSVAVDTACSSSLVAIHQAVTSLWLDEVPLALAGGTMLMAGPGLSVVLDAAGAISSDGRSKAFGQAADGYGRGEGCGFVVLKRLSEARRDGDRILALILGGAVGQDGRTEGIMAPSGQAQEDVLRTACRLAGVDPASIRYVEAHGTGTRVGDPVEAAALARVFGAGRPPGAPCLIGSVKPNVGHLEAAAGVAGLIKVVLALHHGTIPPIRLSSGPAEGIPWGDCGIELARVATPWPASGPPRRAGVTSYGYGGTLAHVIVEEAPRAVTAAARPQPVQLASPSPSPDGSPAPAAQPAHRPDAGFGGHVTVLAPLLPAGIPSGPSALAPVHGPDPDYLTVYPISAADPGRLGESAACLADWLATHPDLPLTSAGYTLAVRRNHLAARAAVVAADRAELIRGLRRLADSGSPGAPASAEPETRATPSTPAQAPTSTTPRTLGRPDLPQTLQGVRWASPAVGAGVGGTEGTGAERGVVWVFSGHGAQWTGMGSELAETEPTFAAALERLDPVYERETGVSATGLLRQRRALNTMEIQRVTYALQYGLAKLWRSLGVRPAAVMGHSVGEIAAAVVAGVLDPLDGARLACRRAGLLGRIAGRGAMVLVGLGFDDAARWLAGRDDIEAAVASSPGSTVISGDPAALNRLWAEYPEVKAGARPVASDVAFHSAQTRALGGDLAAAVAGLSARPPDLPLYGTTLADPRDPAPRGAEYWAANLGSPVRFAQAVAAAAEDGHRAFLEVSAQPVVAHSIHETTGGFVAHSLRRDRPERRALRDNLAALYAAGVAVDWRAVHPAAPVADLPVTRWQHVRHWVEHPPLADGAAAPSLADECAAQHTLLGRHGTVQSTTLIGQWRARLDEANRPYPGRHRVRDVEIVPAAVLLTTFLTAASGSLDGGAVRYSAATTTGSGNDGGAGGDGATTGRARETRDRRNGGQGLQDVSLRLPVAVPDPGEPDREVQVVMQDDFARLSSRLLPAGSAEPGGGCYWLTHATARRHHQPAIPAALPEPVMADPADPGEVIARLARVGVAGMGLDWRIDRLRAADGILLADVITDEPTASWAPLLDAALSIASTIFPGPATLRMPAHLDAVTVHAPPSAKARIMIRRTGEDTVDTDINPADGEIASGPAVALRGLRYGLLEPPPDLSAQLVHCFAWTPLTECSAPGTPGGLRAAVHGDDACLVAGLRQACQEAPGRTVTLASSADAMDLFVAPMGADGPAAAVMRLREALVAVATSGRAARVWCVTRGVREPTSVAAAGGGALWGFGRAAAGEYPQHWGGVIDLPARPGPADYAAALRVAGQRPGEDVVAIDGGRPWVTRLKPGPPTADGGGPCCRPDASYLITGGTGALGLRTARWLAERGARRLILLSRTPAGPDHECVRELAVTGVDVRLIACDCADAAAMRAAIGDELPGSGGSRGWADRGGGPGIRGVVHAAGVVENVPIAELDEASLRRTLRPKLAGALVLHELFPPESVDFFVLFSSAGQYLNLPGQAAYAAANAGLDALARHRSRDGRPGTLALAWTSWHNVGMSRSSDAIAAELALRGTSEITADEALAAWGGVSPWAADPAGRDIPGTRHMPGNLAVLRVGAPGAIVPPVLLGLVGGPPGAAAASNWRTLDATARREFVTRAVREAAACALATDPAAVDGQRPLADQGVDSLMAVALRGRLAERLGVNLPATVLWNHPTVDAIAMYLTNTEKS